MNWIALWLVCWVFLGLEKGLKGPLEIGASDIAPSFVFALVTLVGMSANRVQATWAAIGLGLAMDLLFQVPLKGGITPVVVVGPYALAFALSVQLVIALRGLVIKHNPLSMGFLALAGALVAQTVLVAIYTFRTLLGAPFAWDATHQLIAGAGSALYTGVVATGLALVMLPVAEYLGLPALQQRKYR